MVSIVFSEFNWFTFIVTNIVLKSEVLGLTAHSNIKQNHPSTDTSERKEDVRNIDINKANVAVLTSLFWPRSVGQGPVYIQSTTIVYNKKIQAKCVVSVTNCGLGLETARELKYREALLLPRHVEF